MKVGSRMNRRNMRMGRRDRILKQNVDKENGNKTKREWEIGRKNK